MTSDPVSSNSGVLFVTAPHCPHCRAIRPVLGRVADEFSERVVTTELDDPTALEASRWKVRGTPTLIALRDGEELGRLTGQASETEIRNLFTAAAAGLPAKGSVSRQDRFLRVGAGVVLTVWGLIASTPLLGVAGLAAILFGTYDFFRRTSRSSQSLSPVEAARALESPESPLLVDIRTDRERAAKAIPGSVHVPLGDLFAERLVSQGSRNGYVLYCETGMRSGRALKELKRSDIENVSHLAGGMRAWSAEHERTAS